MPEAKDPPAAARARRALETTELIRLQIALLRKLCPNCGQRGMSGHRSIWRITRTDGITRYVKCRGCGFNDKLAVD